MVTIADRPASGRTPLRSNRHQVIEAILRRRSVPPRHLLAPGPRDVDIALMIDAAASAPDHGGLRPFRLIQIMPQGRSRLAEAFVTAERASNPSVGCGDLAQVRERALHAPVLVGFVARLTHDRPDVPPAEQVAAVGAALGYFLLAAHELGAMAVSGAKTRSPLIHATLALGPGEELLCFVGIGHRGQATPAASRRLRTQSSIPVGWCTGALPTWPPRARS